MDTDLRKTILEFLLQIPALQAEKGRKTALLQAGLDCLMPDLDLSGAPRQSLMTLVNALDQYGTVGDTPALVVFLRDIAEQVGNDKQQQIQTFCKKLSPPPTGQPVPRSSAGKPRSQPLANSAPQWDVFLCYAREDRKAARRIYEDLERAGIAAWFDRKRLRPGQNWKLAIKQAMQHSAYILALLSSHSVSKDGYVQKELGEALALLDLLPPEQIFLIPARLDDCEPTHERLRDLHWVDLFETYPEGLKQIIEVLKPTADVEAIPISQDPLSELEPQHPISKNEMTSDIQEGDLQHFSFETVTVNDHGDIISREQHIAKQYTEDLGNGITLDMVYIPGGTFLMGAPETEAESADDERPQHQVIVSPFFLGKYPVTQAQWEAVMGNDPASFKGPQRPVEKASWNEAQEFCQKLSQMTGAIYRLPTEAEWEYACRAGTTTPFYFGDTITPEFVNYDGDHPYGKAPKGAYREETTDVGNFPPNAFGLCDMHGNVLEWCQDWYGAYLSEGLIDPQGPKTGSYRVVRGGSWITVARDCRSAYRVSWSPGLRGRAFGFRLLRAGL